MRLKALVLLTESLVLIISCVYFISSRDVLPIPDKILVFRNGAKTELQKTDPRYDQIVNLTNGRFGFNVSVAQDIIDDTAMKEIRNDGIGIEFIYSTEKLLTRGSGSKPFRYNKLYFQLTSKKYGNEQGSTVYSFQHAENDHYTEYSRGPLKYSLKLVTIVEGI